MAQKIKFHTKVALMVFAMGGVPIAGCGEAPEDDSLNLRDSIKGEQMSTDTEFKIEKTQNIFYQIPSPVEMATLIKKSGSDYNGSLLNDASRAGSYATQFDKAVNLGIYGADLNYASIFEQTTESMKYISAAKTLSDELGITSAFDDNTMTKIETNLGDRDSMLVIISETFWMVDAYLKENDRDNISAMIIAGGWIEGLYLACKLAPQSNNEALRNRIAEQKMSLNDLIMLIGSYSESPQLDDVLLDLNTIKLSYKNVVVDNTLGKTSVDKESGVMTIGGTSKIEMSDETLAEITSTVENIRTKYTNR